MHSISNEGMRNKGKIVKEISVSVRIITFVRHFAERYIQFDKEYIGIIISFTSSRTKEKL